ncbi:hypothetical protein AB1N83_000349 [Pleurotus pulmonarius]
MRLFNTTNYAEREQPEKEMTRSRTKRLAMCNDHSPRPTGMVAPKVALKEASLSETTRITTHCVSIMMLTLRLSLKDSNVQHLSCTRHIYSLVMDIYYRIYDKYGPIGVRDPLFDVTDSKYVGRIGSNSVVPPVNVENISLAIALREGYQKTFEAVGAELYTASSQTALPNQQGLPEGAGTLLTKPLKLKFPINLKKPQVEQSIRFLSGHATPSKAALPNKQGIPEGPASALKNPLKKTPDVKRPMGSLFVGKWSYIDKGTSTHFRQRITSSFTLRMTSRGTIVASSHEQSTTTYTEFVYKNLGDKPRPLPPPDKFTYELSDFKLQDNLHISFLRTDRSTGCSWKMWGSLSQDGKSLTLTANPMGHARRLNSRVFRAE